MKLCIALHTIIVVYVKYMFFTTDGWAICLSRSENFEQSFHLNLVYIILYIIYIIILETYLSTFDLRVAVWWRDRHVIFSVFRQGVLACDCS